MKKYKIVFRKPNRCRFISIVEKDCLNELIEKNLMVMVFSLLQTQGNQYLCLLPDVDLFADAKYVIKRLEKNPLMLMQGVRVCLDSKKEYVVTDIKL